MEEIFEEIREERKRQDEKWGEQNHHPIVWDSIIGEEAGEISKAALESHFDMGDKTLKDYREELIQTAAVCVSAIQSLDRNELGDNVIKHNGFEWTKLGYKNQWMESETGKLYDVLTDKGNIYRGYAQDWGFVPKDESEMTVEEQGEKIEYFREVKDNE